MAEIVWSKKFALGEREGGYGGVEKSINVPIKV
jgi:hypothetical protein